MPTPATKRSLKAFKGGVRPRSAVVVAQTQLAAPAGGTGATAGAYDSAANRNLMITSVNAARTDIAAIMAVLKEHGFIA